MIQEGKLFKNKCVSSTKILQMWNVGTFINKCKKVEGMHDPHSSMLATFPSIS